MAANRWRWRALVAIVLLVVGGATAVGVAGPGRSKATPRVPRIGPASDVYDGDVGDPFILSAPVPVTTGTSRTSFALFGTDDPPDHIPTATSVDLEHWVHGPDALPTLPAWPNPDPTDSLTWAPAALAAGREYLLYVSVQEAASRRECIAVTSASTPAGPFHDALGGSLVCQRSLGGSIDPSVSRDSHGVLHLVWKSDGNCCGLPAGLWQQQLRSDGLALTGQPHRLLTADEPWQGGIIENPALLPASAGGWWLFYSGNRFDVAAYATGLAYCPTLTGPCRETSSRPFLAGTGTQYSPGGLDFFHDAKGALWASFATWNRPSRNGRFYCCRSLNIAPVVHA